MFIANVEFCLVPGSPNVHGRKRDVGHFISVVHPLRDFSICTSASQHVFVAQQAVMWAAALGRESAIISVLYLQPARFRALAKTSCMAQCHRHLLQYICPPALLPWELWGWAGHGGGCKGGWRAQKGDNEWSGGGLSGQSLSICSSLVLEEDLQLGFWKYLSEFDCLWWPQGHKTWGYSGPRTAESRLV